MSSKIYLVVGSAGEYSDWTCWRVAAYTTPEAAEAKIERIEAEVVSQRAAEMAHYASERQAGRDNSGHWNSPDYEPRRARRFEPKMTEDTEGADRYYWKEAEYEIEELELFGGDAKADGESE